jgi:hypothetical protein
LSGDHTHVGLFRKYWKSGLVHRGRNHGFDESRDDRLGRGDVDRPIQSDDTAECRDAVGIACATISLGDGMTDGCTARIRVFDDDSGRFFKFEGDPSCRVQVEQVRI